MVLHTILFSTSGSSTCHTWPLHDHPSVYSVYAEQNMNMNLQGEGVEGNSELYFLPCPQSKVKPRTFQSTRCPVFGAFGM